MSCDPEINTHVERTDPRLVKGLGAHASATLHEANQRRGILHGLHRVVPGPVMAGTAVTCLNYPGDNLMIQAAIEVCRPGDVLVAGFISPCLHGMLGDLLATASRAAGIAGVVIDSGVRDIEELRRIGLPVFSRGVSQQGTTKSQPGDLNTAISCGGTIVRPGDVIVGDEDGVVCIERESARSVLARADQREEDESAVRAAFGQGGASIVADSVRAQLEDHGLPVRAPSGPGYL